MDTKTLPELETALSDRIAASTASPEVKRGMARITSQFLLGLKNERLKDYTIEADPTGISVGITMEAPSFNYRLDYDNEAGIVLAVCILRNNAAWAKQMINVLEDEQVAIQQAKDASNPNIHQVAAMLKDATLKEDQFTALHHTERTGLYMAIDVVADIADEQGLVFNGVSDEMYGWNFIFVHPDYEDYGNVVIDLEAFRGKFCESIHTNDITVMKAAIGGYVEERMAKKKANKEQDDNPTPQDPTFELPGSPGRWQVTGVNAQGGAILEPVKAPVIPVPLTAALCKEKLAALNFNVPEAAWKRIKKKKVTLSSGRVTDARLFYGHTDETTRKVWVIGDATDFVDFAETDDVLYFNFGTNEEADQDFIVSFTPKTPFDDYGIVSDHIHLPYLTLFNGLPDGLLEEVGDNEFETSETMSKEDLKAKLVSLGFEYYDQGREWNENK